MFLALAKVVTLGFSLAMSYILYGKMRRGQGIETFHAFLGGLAWALFALCMGWLT